MQCSRQNRRTTSPQRLGDGLNSKARSQFSRIPGTPVANRYRTDIYCRITIIFSGPKKCCSWSSPQGTPQRSVSPSVAVLRPSPPHSEDIAKRIVFATRQNPPTELLRVLRRAIVYRSGAAFFVGGLPGIRRNGSGRNGAERCAGGTVAETPQRSGSLIFAGCHGHNPSSGMLLSHPRNSPAGGWKWQRGGCSAPGNSAGIAGLRTVASNIPPTDDDAVSSGKSGTPFRH
jgi:hypothetical protein